MQRAVYHDVPVSEGEASFALWRDQWANTTLSETKTLGVDTRIEQSVFSIPANDLVALESGCGNGKWMWAFIKRGYTAVGLDFCFSALCNVKRCMPDAMVVCADVRHLPFKDSCFDIVTSWGVLEHLKAGQELAVREHARCLRGDLFVTVPRISPSRLMPHVFVRRVLSGSDFFRRLAKRNPKCFFQYEYTSRYFKLKLQEGGVRVLFCVPVESTLGVLDDCKPFGAIIKFLTDPFIKSNLYSKLLNWYFGAFTLYKCIR